MKKRILRLYVWENLDGMLFVPWVRPNFPGKEYGRTGVNRVFVGTDRALAQRVINRAYHAPDFNDVQVQALVDLVLWDGKGTADAHKDYDEVVFHSGNAWRDRGCPDGRRGKILSRVALS